MAKKDSCIFIPFVNGKASEAYRGLSAKLQDRPLVNLLYSAYLVNGTADAMDQAGYKRNEQGEHSADDIYKFFGGDAIMNERSVGLNTAARQLGIMDSNNQPVDMTASEAYDKATTVNNTNKGRVAFVVQSGDKFNVILENKDSRTQERVAEVNEQLNTWQAFQEGMRNMNIDVDYLADAMPELVNPLNVVNFLSYLNSLYRVQNKDLTERDIKAIIATSKQYSTVKALLNRWGDIDTAAKNAFELMQNPTNYAQSTVNLVGEALMDGRRVVHEDLIKLSNNIRNKTIPDFRKTAPEYKVKSKLEALHRKFGIDSEVIVRNSSEIRTLSDAAVDAVVALQRQIRTLKDKQGNTELGARLENTMNSLLNELSKKKYYAGLLSFLKQASSYGRTIDNILLNIPQQGTNLEYARARADAYAKAKNYMDIYFPIVSALSNLDNIIIDESLSKEDRDNLKSTAKDLYEGMRKYDGILNDIREETMIDMCKEVFGDKPIDGKPIAVFVKMAREDSSIMDYLYSMARVSNPLIAAMGTIIRDAQTERDGNLNIISERIRKANADLGGSSEFMYEMIDGQYYLLSPYDWKAFNSARSDAYKGFKYQMGLNGFELQDAMNKWDEEHMDDLVVDSVTGRTEKVPNASFLRFDNPLDRLTDKQRAYYDTMMQIKGELGSLLPAYAQKQFLPPQRRASWTDIVKRGIEGKLTGKEVAKNLLDRMNPIKIRQDDTRYAQNSINIDGEAYVNASGAFDNTLLRRIPIYYMNRLDNQKDLLTDFSAALAGFAATALNYDAMSSIKDTIDLMADFVGNQEIAHKSGEKNLADITKTQGVAIARQLKQKSEGSRTQALLEGFVEQHIYGITMKDTNVASRILQALINYTSMRQLTVNVKGAISNALMGEAQMLIEANAGLINGMFGRDTMYNTKNYAMAHLILMGDKLNPGVIKDHLTGNRTSKGVLLEELFDPMQEVYDDLGSRRFSTFARLYGGINTMAMYSVGESLIHIVNMYAMLDHIKVLKDGKKISLYQAIEVAEPESKNSHLVLKDGVTDLEGNPIDINSDFIMQAKKKIRYINQNTHGSMNTEDKGLIQRRIAGRAVMNFRQWMVEHYSRRYRGRHWDGTVNDFVEGYWVTVGKMIRDYVKDFTGFVSSARAVWGNLDDNQKNNVMRALSEVSILASLVLLSQALGDPTDHKKEWWYRMWIYQVKRLILDERASVPWGIPGEAKTIIQSPVASVNTVNAILYPVIGFANGDWHETLKSGRYKGWNKYERNLLKYTVPFYGQIDQMLHMDEEDYIFNMFNTQRNY